MAFERSCWRILCCHCTLSNSRIVTCNKTHLYFRISFTSPQSRDICFHPCVLLLPSSRRICEVPSSPSRGAALATRAVTSIYSRLRVNWCLPSKRSPAPVVASHGRAWSQTLVSTEHCDGQQIVTLRLATHCGIRYAVSASRGDDDGSG